MPVISSEEVSKMVAGQTVPTRFLDTVRRIPGQVALRWREGDGWGELTFADYAERAAHVAAGLGALGVERGTRVVLMMRNRPEFHVADMAVLLCGGTPISIYNSSAPEQVQYLAHHCEAQVAIVEDLDFLDRILKVRDELPALREIVVIDDPEARAPEGVHRWESLLASNPVDLDVAAQIVQPSDLATVIYTSGTTGPPKGVMLDHENVCWTVESLRLSLDEFSTEGRRVVSYLPMAHIAERMTSHYQGAALGYEVTTCPEAGKVATYLPSVRPEVMFAVPRIWEKIYAGIQAIAAADPENQKKLEAALEVGRQVAEHDARGEELPPELQAAFAKVDAQVLSPLRAVLGLDQLVAAVTGAAPIPIDILQFFRSLRVPLSEIYGLSESSGPMTWAPFTVKPGTVGPAIPGCEVTLADDGEVICRGGNVYRGYLNDPEKTAEALDDDGWLHSGDIGTFDADGYLRIVDRKKELIITAGGKNISPANLEAALKSSPVIGQVCVVGDNRPFISALIVLDPEVAPAWAKQHGIEADTLEDLAAHPEVHAEVERNVAAANERFSQVERVKKFALLGAEWLPDSEELTPTMKLKRRGIHQKYADEIEAFYRR
ncbi:MAG TPA: long-chain fatty acid--CoA ligase [Acidimicrobiia bacterium]|nr:long-chain fatty acid--CoA ligase [Acidimicrobiia bacterium]